MQAVAGQDQDPRVVDSRRLWPGVHSVDVHPPHLLQPHDERVGGHRHAARE